MDDAKQFQDTDSFGRDDLLLLANYADPCIFRESGITYLLFSVSGESEIAGAVLSD